MIVLPADELRKEAGQVCISVEDLEHVSGGTYKYPRDIETPQKQVVTNLVRKFFKSTEVWAILFVMLSY
jgi:hypothetical protein